jgi:hypothetical protein
MEANGDTITRFLTSFLYNVPDKIGILTSIVEQIQEMISVENASDQNHKKKYIEKLRSIHKEIKDADARLSKIVQIADDFSNKIKNITGSLLSVIFSIVPFYTTEKITDPFTVLVDNCNSIDLEAYKKLQNIEKNMSELLAKLHQEEQFCARMITELNDIGVIGIITADDIESRKSDILITYRKGYRGMKDVTTYTQLELIEINTPGYLGWLGKDLETVEYRY